MQLRDRNSTPTSTTRKSSMRGKKIVIGDTIAKRVSIFTGQDEGEEDDNNVNLVSEYETTSTREEDDNNVNFVSEYETTPTREEEDNNVNFVSESDTSTQGEKESTHLQHFELSENTINRIYQCMQPDEDALLQLYTAELTKDPETPTTLHQALTSRDKLLWRQSAIAEVNNFLKRESWKFIQKSTVKRMGRKLIGVK